MKECVAFLLDFLPCDRLKEDAWEGDLNLMVRSYAPSLARRNACFSMGADPWTTDLDSVAQDVSYQACPSFEVASGDQPAYITDWITSLSAQKNIPGSPLAQDGPVLLFQPPSFSPKRTVLTLENVEGKKPGSIRTSPTIRAVSLSTGIPFFSTEKRQWITGLSGVERNQSCASQSLPPNLWDFADYLELILPDLQGWGFSDVAPYCGGTAQEKVKWLRLLCYQGHWAERLTAPSTVLLLAPSAWHPSASASTGFQEGWKNRVRTTNNWNDTWWPRAHLDPLSMRSLSPRISPTWIPWMSRLVQPCLCCCSWSWLTTFPRPYLSPPQPLAFSLTASFWNLFFSLNPHCISSFPRCVFFHSKIEILSPM